MKDTTPRQVVRELLLAVGEIHIPTLLELLELPISTITTCVFVIRQEGIVVRRDRDYLYTADSNYFDHKLWGEPRNPPELSWEMIEKHTDLKQGHLPWKKGHWHQYFGVYMKRETITAEGKIVGAIKMKQSHKLKAWVVEMKDYGTVEVGRGMSYRERRDMWQKRKSYIGTTTTFKLKQGVWFWR